ncbi:hypothetical protein MSKU9_0627 [Komagataeibacter diospyri]|uniref:TonB C-terminal domain-containing protein n=1 Tax=Komagataeibacter diospyri TaxID=1932662 RepID=A0A4P5NX55_9PROT|nr:hypothetical protein MSKU9_0627 [Komagataeibacter diospyri]
MDRRGRVLSVRFRRNSGSIMLDNATMIMFMRQTIPLDLHAEFVGHADVTVNYTLLE